MKLLLWFSRGCGRPMYSNLCFQTKRQGPSLQVDSKRQAFQSETTFWKENFLFLVQPVHYVTMAMLQCYFPLFGVSPLQNATFLHASPHLPPALIQYKTSNIPIQEHHSHTPISSDKFFSQTSRDFPALHPAVQTSPLWHHIISKPLNAAWALTSLGQPVIWVHLRSIHPCETLPTIHSSHQESHPGGGKR